jgi:hypothetical protein
MSKTWFRQNVYGENRPLFKVWYLLFGTFEFVSDFEIRASDLSVRGQYSLHFAEKVFQADRLGLVAVEALGQHRCPVVSHR